MTAPATIYLDNAATSWPKPDVLGAAIAEHFTVSGGNPGRSAHPLSAAATRVVTTAREAVADTFTIRDPARIAFTSNGTYALNLALYGLLTPGDRVVTTAVEHNSVMRPLRDLEARGVEVAVVPCDGEGRLDLDALRKALFATTALVVTTHASNVTGTIVPLDEVSRITHDAGALLLVDAAQTAGGLPIDVGPMGIDLLAFTGHKGLMGPTGTGGLYVREGVEFRPLVRGATGTESAQEHQPSSMPEAFESGTANVAGLVGLTSSLHFLHGLGVLNVQVHERALVARLLDGFAGIDGVRLLGPPTPTGRSGIVSFTVAGASPVEVARRLEEQAGILVRAGLHCAPAAHRTAGTFPDGAVRASVGWFNTLAEMDTAVEAVREVAAWAGARGQSAGGR